MIKRIGSLGLHEGINSDHGMLYMDCSKDTLFKGVFNRLVMNPARKFVIEHADKCEKFLAHFRKLAEDKNFKTRIETISCVFKKHGDTPCNVERFNDLDKELTEYMLSVARKVAKKYWLSAIAKTHDSRAETTFLDCYAVLQE